MKRSNPPNPAHLNVYPVGGLGEIGMNLLALEVGSEVMLFDCGMMFQDLSGWGLDYCLPNFTKLFEWGDRIQGLVLTHGHEDHIGAVGHFIQAFPHVPIYASALTRDLVLAKTEDFPALAHKRLRIFQDRKAFTVGRFELTAVCVSHSIPDAHGFVIDCAAGRIIHSGDMRYEYDHPRKFSKWFHRNHYFREYLDRPILCYFGDSTNVEQSHRLVTEDTVGKNLENLIRTHKEGTLFITLFSSNMERLARVFESVHRVGKKMVLCGRSMHTYVDIGQKYNIIPRYRNLLVDDIDFDQLPRHQVVVVTTGSQAEPRSALMRIAQNTHPTVWVEVGDRVVMSSRFIPGNERNISRMINALMIQGAQITTDADVEIHVSGHAYREESEMTLEAIRPQYFIPVHGEYHHLMAHAKLANDLGRKGPEHVLVIRNGKAVSLRPEGHAELPDFDVSRWTYDYGKVVPLVSPPISQRKRLGRHGLVVCSLKPKLHLVALGGVIDDNCIQACEAHRKGLLREKNMSSVDRCGAMRAFLQKYFRKTHDRKPYVWVTEEAFDPHDTP